MRRFILGTVLCICALPALSATSDAWSWFLAGPWAVAVEGQTRDRVLLLPKVNVTADGQIGAEGAVYGWIDSKLSPVHGFEGRIEGSQAHLKLITNADSLITASMTMDDGSLLGTFLTKSGNSASVRLTKLTSAELASIRQGAQIEKTLARTALSQSSKVTLLYVGAGDCPSCRGYEIEYFGRKNLMQSQVPEFKQIRYVHASLGSYRGCSGLASVLPEDLSPLARGDKPRLSCSGTPYFAALVDDKVISTGFGMGALEKLIIPTINGLNAKQQALQNKN